MVFTIFGAEVPSLWDSLSISAYNFKVQTNIDFLSECATTAIDFTALRANHMPRG